MYEKLFLESLIAEKGYSINTYDSYKIDLKQLQDFYEMGHDTIPYFLFKYGLPTHYQFLKLHFKYKPNVNNKDITILVNVNKNGVTVTATATATSAAQVRNATVRDAAWARLEWPWARTCAS